MLRNLGFIETFALTLRIVLPLLDLLLSKSIQKMTEALGNFPSCVMLSFTFFCCRETRGNVSVAFFRTVAWLPVDIARSRVISIFFMFYFYLWLYNCLKVGIYLRMNEIGRNKFYLEK